MHFVDAVEICLKQNIIIFHKTFFSLVHFAGIFLIDFWCFEYLFKLHSPCNANVQRQGTAQRIRKIDKDIYLSYVQLPLEL